MKALIDETPELQYKIELYGAGMLDQPSNNQDVSEARTRLHQREDAWNRLQPLQEIDVPPSTGSPVHEYLMMKTGPKFDRAFQFASFSQLSPEPQWGLPSQWELNFDFPVQHLHVYPEANLLIAMVELEDQYALLESTSNIDAY